MIVQEMTWTHLLHTMKLNGRLFMTLHLPMSVQEMALVPLYYPTFTYDRQGNGTGAPILPHINLLAFKKWNA